jgi:hypothetical protein
LETQLRRAEQIAQASDPATRPEDTKKEPSSTRLGLEMMHDRVDTINVDLRVLDLAVPNTPVQSLDLGDDHRLRRHALRIMPVRALLN